MTGFEEWWDGDTHGWGEEKLAEYALAKAAWTAALAAARPYMKHGAFCMTQATGGEDVRAGKCTCGLAALLKEANLSSEKPDAS